MASWNLAHTTNLLAYICILCMRFFAPWLCTSHVLWVSSTFTPVCLLLPMLSWMWFQYIMPCVFSRGWSQTSSTSYPYTLLGVLFHVLLFFFIIWRQESWVKSHQCSLTIFSSTWCHIKGALCFYFVVWCISIGTKQCCMEISLWNWLSAVVLSGWSSSFFS